MEPATNKPRNSKLRIGLTGGIASGKSTVAKMFSEHGVPVIDTDIIARQVVEPGQPGLDAVAARFGADLVTPDGRLDRRRLRNRVFDDTEERRALEAILHPLIQARTVELADQASGPYLLLVVPLLIETGFRTLVDRVLVVDCPEAQQRTRLLSRDGETPERVERILAAQANRNKRLSAADDVIDNTNSPEETLAQVTKLHEHYLHLAKSIPNP